MSNSHEIREFFVTSRAALLRRPPMNVVQGEGARQWLNEHADLVDETLRRIYVAASEEAQSEHPEHHDEPEVVLLALGGYGRRELCPFSDVDIAFVPAEEEHPLLDAVIKEAFRLIVDVFMDGAKMEVGYAYRPLSDCAHLDHTAKAALLESRLIAGSEGLHWRMRDELHRRWDGVEFILEQRRARRALENNLRFSLYAVEPNLKEGIGALRELQSALWSVGALYRSREPLRDLEWRGLASTADCENARQANEFFLKLRVWLHLSAQKKGDVLPDAKQEALARDLGYGGGAAAWQRLMRDYYRHAENVLRFSRRVMRRLLEGPLPLDEHFNARHRRVSAAHPHVLQNHPELLMTPFALSRKYGFSIDTELQLLIEDAIPLMNDAIRRHSIVRAGFLALLDDVDNAADNMADLRARGVLGRLIPEFASMLYLSPADPSHELTVGEHSILCLRRLSEMSRARRDDEMMFSVWSGVDDLEVLMLGTLLHDVGKIEPNTDHSESGAVLARQIAERFGLSPERSERVALLVRRHLLLPRAARLRDVSEPGTLRSVMELVGDVNTLKMLYLLSLADTRAVGERAHSSLEIDAMSELYRRVLLAMTQEEAGRVLTDSEAREEMAQRERDNVRREMRRLHLDNETMQRLSENLPASYVLNTPLSTIAAHMKFLEQLPQEKLIVDFFQEAREPYTEMTVIAYDDPAPGMLSKICGVVYAAGFTIHQAKVFTLHTPEYSGNGEARGLVLDQLYLSRDGRALSESQGARLAALLREILLGDKTLDDVLKSAGKSAQTPIAPQRIAMRNDLSDEHSVLTVVSENLPGLMFYLSRALASMGLDIHSAKVTTWAGQAEDAFYITRRDAEGQGEKIADEEIASLLDELGKRLRQPEQQELVL